MKRIICFVAAVLMLPFIAFAGLDDSAFDLDEQLDALGREELESRIPEEARELMRETDTDTLSVGKLLQLSPRDFVKATWGMAVNQAKQPVRTLAAITGIIVLCALTGGLKPTGGESSFASTFTVISVLCIITAIITPILDCIVDTSRTIQNAALFMLSYIPAFSAALTASGSPLTGTAYSMFLLTACQVVSQIAAYTLIPLMGIYLALCVMGSLVPEVNISSATGMVRSTISWMLGFFLTIFVGLLSIQTMVTQSADTVAVKATKFMIGSFVPVVGSSLSEAYSAAQGCLKLIKTTLGAYGLIVAVCTFLPIFLKTVAWYMLTNIAVIISDIAGVPRVSGILKACASVLGILIAIILCFSLLIIVSTAIVMVTGMGTA